MKAFLTPMVFLALATSALAGCSGAPQEEAGNSEGAAYATPAPSAAAPPAASSAPAAATVQAFLEAKPIKGQIGGLSVDVQSANVVTPSKLAIGEKISASLPQKLEDFAYLGESGNVTGDVTPSLNESNVLSLILSVDIDSYSHPVVRPLTFDLGTGDRIALERALSPQGLQIVQTECEATLKENNGNVSACADSLKPGEEGGGVIVPVAYTVSKSGINFMPRTAAFVDFANGVDIPWSKLKGQITNPTLKALADKAR